jgi:heme-degrading monooxygenase HmoA
VAQARAGGGPELRSTIGQVARELYERRRSCLLVSRVMVIVLIRTRLRADADVAAYEQLNARMEALVADIPGYASARGYRSDDGDQISIIRFESAAALRAWRDLPEHAAAQQRGRDEFFETYDVEVCEVTRAYDFARAAPGSPGSHR